MTVRNGLLALLGDGPTYGFQLKTLFEGATANTWDLNIGQVYTTLERLERDGLVSVYLDEGQKRYQLTRAGEEALEQWWAAVPGDEPPPRDELLLKVMMALPHGRDHALDVVTHQRSALLDLLARRQREAVERRRLAGEPGGPAIDLAADLMTDALVMRLEADVRWLDRCEARLLEAHPSAFTLPRAHDDTNDHESPSTPPATWRIRSAPTKATRQ